METYTVVLSLIAFFVGAISIIGLLSIKSIRLHIVNLLFQETFDKIDSLKFQISNLNTNVVNLIKLNNKLPGIENYEMLGISTKYPIQGKLDLEHIKNFQKKVNRSVSNVAVPASAIKEEAKRLADSEVKYESLNDLHNFDNGKI